MTSALPLKDSERDAPRTLEDAVDGLKGAFEKKRTEFYNRPIPEGTKAVMHRIMGEKPD
jgi:hypothetical protein